MNAPNMVIKAAYVQPYQEP